MSKKSLEKLTEQELKAYQQEVETEVRRRAEEKERARVAALVEKGKRLYDDLTIDTSTGRVLNRDWFNFFEHERTSCNDTVEWGDNPEDCAKCRLMDRVNCCDFEALGQVEFQILIPNRKNWE